MLPLAYLSEVAVVPVEVTSVVVDDPLERIHHPADPKTNQFNLTTRRRSLEDVRAWRRRDHADIWHEAERGRRLGLARDRQHHLQSRGGLRSLTGFQTVGELALIIDRARQRAA